MVKDRNTTIGFVLASILVQILFQVIKGIQLNIVGILGGTFGLMLLPYLLTLSIRWIYKALSWDFNENSFLWTFITIWIIVLFLNLVTIIYESGQRQVDIGSDKSSSYKYSPKGCLYQIEFKNKPKIGELATTDGKSILKAEAAELVMTDDKGFVKSEFIVLGKDTIKSFTKDILYNILMEYSLSNGLAHPEFKNSENEMGKQVELRGYKTLKDEKLNERRLIMTAHLYLKENNLIILYGASEAKDYPKPEITKFVNSIKLKKSAEN